MTASVQPHLAAMMTAAELEWRTYAPEDWTAINFWRWPRGFHRSAWVIAGYIGWNPLDALDRSTPPSARRQRAADPALRHVRCRNDAAHPGPADPDEPLLAWFNAAVSEHQHGIAEMIEGLGDAYWNLPTSRRWAARRLVKMWEKDGVAAFRDLSASLVNKPPSLPGYP